MSVFFANVRRQLYRHIIYPAVVRVRGEGRTFSYLDELRVRQWQSRKKLRDRQQTRLRDLLEYASRDVSFYRERWDLDVEGMGGDPFDILRSLPLVTKEDLQRHAEALTSKRASARASWKTTGGSTGEPVRVLKDSEALASERAASWLGYGWFGIEIGDRGARFWGSPTEFGKRKLRFAAADVAMNRIRFSAFAFSDEHLDEYWRECVRVRPDYFYGYVSMLVEFGRFVKARDLDGAELDLKAVITTAEPLTEAQRELLEEAFDAPVQNEYGCGEVGPLAYECTEGGLHVMVENVIVEILRDDGAPAEVGESGEVVVTDLHNRAMPLIRYRLGDRAVRGGECVCGRNLPLLASVQGRKYDFVQDSSGRRYHGEYFMYIFEDLRVRGAVIDRFRVVQPSAGVLNVRVASHKGLSAREKAFIRSRLATDMPGMDVSVECKEELELPESGKSRIILNEWLSDDAGSVN